MEEIEIVKKLTHKFIFDFLSNLVFYSYFFLIVLFYIMGAKAQPIAYGVGG